MGLYADRAIGYLYSVSEDGTFKLTDINKHLIVSEFSPGGAPLK